MDEDTLQKGSACDGTSYEGAVTQISSSQCRELANESYRAVVQVFKTVSIAVQLCTAHTDRAATQALRDPAPSSADESIMCPYLDLL